MRIYHLDKFALVIQLVFICFNDIDLFKFTLMGVERLKILLGD